MKVLVINPGSTSTKLAIFDERRQQLHYTNLYHNKDQLQKFNSLWDQYRFRLDAIESFINDSHLKLSDFDGIIGRGGLLHPIYGGVYLVEQNMLDDLKSCRYGEHASNLGAPLAYHLATKAQRDIPAYILDPVIVDELDDIARYSGHPLFPRKSIFHALGQKAVAKNYASQVGSTYQQLSLIVAHMGGGITIGAHHKGRVIDVNNGLDGEGPFSPERSGTLPVGELLKKAFSGDYSYEQMKKMVKGEGGLVSYLHTSDCREVEKMILNGDKNAKSIYEAMAYDVSKYIGAMATVLKGQVDAIILSGGLAHSDMFCQLITSRIEFLAPVFINQQECEMTALATGGLDALQNRVTVHHYRSSSNSA